MMSSFWSLLNPFALLGGVVTAVVFLTHGAIFLSLKTDGDMRIRAQNTAAKLSIPAVIIAGVWGVWAQIAYSSHTLTWVPLAVAALSLIATVALTSQRAEGWAFISTVVAIIGVAVFIFGTLFPNVLPAFTPENSLTIANASSTPYTLKIMTWVAVVLTPVVLGYQGWTYYVFRQRLKVEHIPEGGGLPRQEPSDLHPKP